MRVLATSTANSGHFGPLVPVLKALAGKGHQVLVVAGASLEDDVRAAGLDFRRGGEPPRDELAAIWERVPTVSRDEAAILVNREIFGRLDTQALLPSVERAIDEFQPALIVHEPAEFASAVAAYRRGLPHVHVAIGLASVEAASVRIAEPAFQDYGPDFVESLMQAPYLTHFPASLDPSAYPDTRRFHEGTLRHPPLPDWWEGSLQPLVYVSFGTVAGRLPIAPLVYRAAVEAVDELPVRVLISTGRTRDIDNLGTLPSNVHAAPWVDQQAALDASSLVVCHGGAGTTFGALAAGVPLVVVPFMADQPTNGRLVAAAGAGLVVLPGDVDAESSPPLAIRLRAAVEETLGTPSYRTAAEGIAQEMREMPLLHDVVDAL